MSTSVRMIPRQRLKWERQRRGWSREYVAEQIGVADPKTIGRWERGAAFPSAYFLQRLCWLFGMLAQDLGLLREEHEERLSLAGTDGSVGSDEVSHLLIRLIEACYQHLDVETRAVLAQLAHLPASQHGFSEEVALWISRGKREYLATLVGAGLLQIRESGRYWLHPIIADYAIWQAPNMQRASEHNVQQVIRETSGVPLS